MKVLFVCTGNSCRSVMAEGLLKQLLKQKGSKNIQVTSAGVSAVGGAGATLETIHVMKDLGIDVSNHLGQPLTPELVSHADLIFCMEEFHRDLILFRSPEAAPKIHLLRAFEVKEPVLDANIPDPIGQPKEMYESCLMTIQEAVERLLSWLEKRS